ncbi:MAG: zinc-binding dehydrogenase [Anaerolineae bacterium]|nr:zinc-binding dehydrogenase [Anaerolineae bacterium]
MKQAEAIVFTGVGQVELRTIEVADPKPDEVQVRTQFSTISAGTEGWILQNLFTWKPTDYPCVPGYQRVGVIEALGADVTGWQVGERVVATISRHTGVHAQSGSHAALGNTPASEIYAVPEGTDDIDASGTVVAQVGYNAASRAVIEPGDWAVVYGDGLIGQSAAQAIRARGAKVILVGHRADRLALASAHSADVVINNHEQSVVEMVHSQTGGKPVTVVLDTVQKEATQREYTPLLEREKGQIVYSGFTSGTTWADMALLQQREFTAHFVSGWTRARMEATLNSFATGKMHLHPLITHFVSYQQGPEMYRKHLNKGASFLGMTMDWREAAS